MLILLLISLPLFAGQKCSNNRVQKIHDQVEKLDLSKIAMLHRRATTLDYAHYKLNPVDEKRFREEVKARYEANKEEIEARIKAYHAQVVPTQIAVRVHVRQKFRRVRFALGLPQEVRQRVRQ